MHGLVLKTVQSFTTDLFGTSRWSEVVAAAGFEFEEFEPVLSYDDAVGRRTLEALCRVLDRPIVEIMEDLGTYLVSHPNCEPVRRLLRFGGASFEEFLHSLSDLPDRARLAMPNLQLPMLEFREHSACHFSLTCRGEIPNFGHVLVGTLRAMADDYGALALVDYRGGSQQTEVLAITLLDTAYASGREFNLGAMIA